MKITSFLIIVIFFISKCNNEKEISKGELLVSKAIEAHGGKKYNNAHYQFVFRDKIYTFKNSETAYEYTVEFLKDGKKYFDKLNNDGLTRTIDEKIIELDVKKQDQISESLNSVIYFATLPHKLSDDSVNKKYVGQQEIKNIAYDLIEITFQQEGGGKDFEDTYYYWINQQTDQIDFLAYNYKVNQGGVRFREAYNVRRVNGIVFQNYINFKAEVGTPLIELAKLWEDGKLNELSRIETENVQKLE